MYIGEGMKRDQRDETHLRAVLSEHKTSLALVSRLLCSLEEVEVVHMAPCFLDVFLSGCVA